MHRCVPLVLLSDFRSFKYLIHGQENCHQLTLQHFHCLIFFKFRRNCTRPSNLGDTTPPTHRSLLSSSLKERGTHWKTSLKAIIMSSVSIGRMILHRHEKESDQRKFFKGIWIRTYYTVPKIILPRKLRELCMALGVAKEAISSILVMELLRYVKISYNADNRV